MPFRFFCILILSLLCACTDMDPDRLYALKLDHAPVAADWNAALPKIVTVKGGRINKVDPLPRIDQDTVHTSTASCHHGSSLPDPVDIDVRAFYTDTDLYLRLSWADPTRNDNMRGWTYNGTSWQSSGDFEDGLGILWDIERKYPDFTCSYACHLDDFGVSGQSFRGHNRMKLFKQGPQLDLWNWKAGRTGHLSFADDRFIDKDGMHGDIPGEIFHPNSLKQARPSESGEIFGKGDRPIYDFDGAAVEGQKLTIFSRAPGYLTDHPSGDRADVVAHSVWRDGRWTVVLRRALDTGSPRDARFSIGENAAISFGIALMDNSLYEHYASTVSQTLVLLPSNGKNTQVK
ncbi:ethylbenzene dehydrogenase-related protein [Geopsychrobacter electrodiphilus]|uniref:ethylbenzene dehydrogenase-related protein n=1 Tax=Geopsychrobacter electrodiphilus TaxID=225196 RepID=UPI00039FA3CB|nr:ethylbenzene dehydrogenase-related protein [Geopsychrobacter electrodiphilus]